MKDQMRIEHEGKHFIVNQDRECDECGMSFYILIFDLSLDAGNDIAGYTDCPHCQNEHVVHLDEVDI